MKLAIISLPGHGPINTMLPLAMELKENGYSVDVLGIAEMGPMVRPSKVNFIPVGEKAFPIGSSLKFLRPLEKCHGLKGIWLTSKMIATWSHIMLTYAPSLLIENQYDLIIANQGVPEAETLSKISRVPFVTICSAALFNQELTVPPVFTTWMPSEKTLLKWRNFLAYQLQGILSIHVYLTLRKHRKKNSLKMYKHINDAFSPLLQISQFPESFEFPRKSLPSHFHFLGPFHSSKSRKKISIDWDWINQNERKLIYASLGSLQTHHIDLYKIIISTVEKSKYMLLLSLGGQPIDILANYPLPSNVRIYSEVPQIDLLEKVDLFISHGGTNSVMEAMLFGIPTLCIPLTNDHRGSAARLKRSGAGDYIHLSKLKRSILKKVMDKMIENPTYLKNAQRLKNEIKLSGQTKKAVNLIIELLRKGNIEGYNDH